MKSPSDLPEIDFGAADYLAAPLPVLAKYATKFKLGRSKRGIEVFDYNLCRDTILSRYFGTGHPYRWHRPPVPMASGHPFRFDPAGDSGVSGHPQIHLV